MTGVECVQLVTFVRARSPQTYLAEGTPDAWFIDLQPFDLTAAQEAVVTLTRRPGNAAISLGDLLAEIRKVRALRLERHGDPVITADPDDTEAFQRELARARKAICDGEPWPAKSNGELTARPVEALTTGRSVPFDDQARVELRQQVRQQAHARRVAVEEQAKAKAEHDAALAAARAELDASRPGVL